MWNRKEKKMDRPIERKEQLALLKSLLYATDSEAFSIIRKELLEINPDHKTTINYTNGSENTTVVSDERSINFIYNKSDVNFPILFVAHVDTVKRDKKKADIVCTTSGIVRNKKGILGADDRAGVAILLALKKLYPQIHLLFTNFEESGAHGAQVFAKRNNLSIEDYKLLVEFDRRGTKHFVSYTALPTEMKKFVEKTTNTEYNAGGSFSDIRILSSTFKIPAVNMATGYTNEHSSSETLNLKWWYASLEYGISLIKAEKEIPLVEKYVPDSFGNRDYNRTNASNYGFYTGKYASAKMEAGAKELASYRDRIARIIENTYPEAILEALLQNTNLSEDALEIYQQFSSWNELSYDEMKRALPGLKDPSGSCYMTANSIIRPMCQVAADYLPEVYSYDLESYIHKLLAENEELQLLMCSKVVEIILTLIVLTKRNRAKTPTPKEESVDANEESEGTANE